MLVRALKVLDLSLTGRIGTDIATAALDQPGDEGCAYGRAGSDWQRFMLEPRRLAGDCVAG
jgi:hypothetical protein